MPTLVTYKKNKNEEHWINMAIQFGHAMEIIVKDDDKNQTSGVKYINISKIVGQDDMDYVIKRTSYDLKLSLPSSQDEYDWLKAQYYISHNVDVLYVLGNVKDNSKINGYHNVNLEGKCAWPVQMFAIRHYGKQQIPVKLISNNKQYSLSCVNDSYIWTLETHISNPTELQEGTRYAIV